MCRAFGGPVGEIAGAPFVHVARRATTATMGIALALVEPQRQELTECTLNCVCR